MINMNEVISSNIINIMKKNGKKQIELADCMGLSKQVVSKMLSGGRVINAVELQQIAEFLRVSMEDLLKCPNGISETNVVKVFMGKVDSAEAKQGLKIADEIADMICFYSNARENAEKMMQPWEG